MVNLNFIKKNNLQLPFFIYDSRIIKRQFLKLNNYLPRNFRLFYSVKANPNIAILKILRLLGANAEISSAGELSRVIKAGFSPDQIIFTGPGKTDEELESALKRRIHLVVVESINEIERINKIAQRLKITQNILIRINPFFMVEEYSSMFSMTGEKKKFGIDEKELPEIIRNIKKFKRINLLGLHSFLASNIFDHKLIVDGTEHLFKIVRDVELKFKLHFPIIDIGGGLPVDYSSQNKSQFDIKDLSFRLKGLVGKYKFKDKDIFLESGRFLVAQAGEYIAKVIDKKNSGGKKIIIIDGGMNHLSKAALLRNSHQVDTLAVSRKKSRSRENVDLVGNLNTPVDLLTKTNLPRVEIGDLVAIKNVGAYGLSTGMVFFSSRPLPKEYLLLENKKLKCI